MPELHLQQMGCGSTRSADESPLDLERETRLGLRHSVPVIESGAQKRLQQDYHLTASEAALVLGSSAEYRISEIADSDASSEEQANC
jgi:hypothetical protein